MLATLFFIFLSNNWYFQTFSSSTVMDLSKSSPSWGSGTLGSGPILIIEMSSLKPVLSEAAAGACSSFRGYLLKDSDSCSLRCYFTHAHSCTSLILALILTHWHDFPA